MPRFPGIAPRFQEPVPRFQGIRFEDALDRYLKHRLIEGKGRKSYQLLRSLWLPAFNGVPLLEITSDQVEEIATNRALERKYQPATWKMALSQLSGLMTFAVRRDWIPSNPVSKVPKPKVDNARERWLRVHEIQAIVKHSPEWLKGIVLFAAKTGMRLGEICSLKYSDYFTDDQGKAYLRTGVTKNGSHLTWPVEGAVGTEIERKKALAFDDDYIFPGPYNGKALMSIRRYFEIAVVKAGLKYGNGKDEITFHTLRRSMATLALNSGVPFPTVKRMGNWRSDTMVHRYALISDETLRLASAHMDRLIG